MCLRTKHIVIIISLILVQCEGFREVATSVGNIKGVISSDGYYQFFGIPYGKVDDDNHFGESTPYPIFTEAFEATRHGVACPQTNAGIYADVQDKDVHCLNLNVYTPLQANPASKLPVLIWLYGGRFDIGSASPKYYGPKFLVRHDVIVVTVNYRGGPYGFMCLDIPDAPGNQGLKDQYLAFQWVQNNIEAFGGNPNEVTVFGQSAGGHSIDLHLISERELLFNKVILQSGSSLAITLAENVDKNAPLKLAAHLGIAVDNLTDALIKLSKVPSENVTTAATELGIKFRPCVEKEFAGVNSFITHEWNNAAVPKVEGIPVLIGFTNKETMATHLNEGPEHFTKDIFYRQINKTFRADDERREMMESDLQTFYLGDDPIDQSSVEEIIDFDSDYSFIYPVHRTVKKYVEGNAKDIYYYMFAYSGGRNLGKIIYNLTDDGAAHVDDVGYLFDWAGISGPISAEDQLTMDRMTTMWTNFAKFGNPTPETTAILPVQWIPLTKETYNYLRIDCDLVIKQRPLNKRMSYLDLFYRFNKDYEKLYGVSDYGIS